MYYRPLVGCYALDMDDSNMNNSTKPKLFLYALILPVIWLGFGTLFSQIFPEQNLGLMGLVIILYIALLPVSWHFAKHYERQFVKNEKIRLIAYLTLWAVVCESFALLYHLNQPNSPEFEPTMLLCVIGFTFLVDLVFMFLGVHFICKRYIRYFLGRRETASA